MNSETSGRQVRVGGFVSRAQGELARSYLAQHGVYAVVVADDAGGVAPHFSLEAGGVALTVPAAQADEARRLLSSSEGLAYKVHSRTHRVGKALLAVVVAVIALWIVVDTLQLAR